VGTIVLIGGFLLIKVLLPSHEKNDSGQTTPPGVTQPGDELPKNRK
jgi:hypothetical protein